MRLQAWIWAECVKVLVNQSRDLLRIFSPACALRGTPLYCPPWKHNLSGSSSATTLHCPFQVFLYMEELEVNAIFFLTKHLPLDLLVHESPCYNFYFCSCFCSSTGRKTISRLTSLWRVVAGILVDRFLTFISLDRLHSWDWVARVGFHIYISYNALLIKVDFIHKVYTHSLHTLIFL